MELRAMDGAIDRIIKTAILLALMWLGLAMVCAGQVAGAEPHTPVVRAQQADTGRAESLTVGIGVLIAGVGITVTAAFRAGGLVREIQQQGREIGELRRRIEALERARVKAHDSDDEDS